MPHILSHLMLSALLTLSFHPLSAQTLPVDGGRRTYDMHIDFGRAYLSGVCVMLRQNDTIKASVVNEFGVSYVDFICPLRKGRVTLVSLTPKLDRWYIRRKLRKDLRALIDTMSQGGTRYKGYEMTPRDTVAGR